MLVYDAVAAVFGLIGGALIVVALFDAARRRSWRWVVTILLLPVVGAMAWWIAGRRAYRAEPANVAD